jgi:hypothetical protein
LYFSLRVRDVRDLPLFVFLALVPDFSAAAGLLFFEVLLDVDLAAAGFLAVDAFAVGFFIEALFLPEALLFAAGVFLDSLSLLDVFFV